MIAAESHGVPRTINILCDKSLVYAYSQGAPAVHKRIVEQVLEDQRNFGVFSGKTGPQEVLSIADRDKRSR